MIDSWTTEAGGSPKQFEDAIEKLNLRITDEERKKIEMERKEKVELRMKQLREEQEAELGKQKRKEKFTLELEQ